MFEIATYTDPFRIYVPDSCVDFQKIMKGFKLYVYPGPSFH